MVATSSTWKAVQVIDEKVIRRAKSVRGRHTYRQWTQQNLARLGKNGSVLAPLRSIRNDLAYCSLASHSPVWLILARGSMEGPEVSDLALSKGQ